MKMVRWALHLISAVLVISMTNGAAYAQTPGSGASAPTSKATRKAQRKQARAKNNAELKKLESAGYKPSGDQTNYPDNMQGAVRKTQ
jgi:hypothetical protein